MLCPEQCCQVIEVLLPKNKIGEIQYITVVSHDFPRILSALYLYESYASNTYLKRVIPLKTFAQWTASRVNQCITAIERIQERFPKGIPP